MAEELHSLPLAPPSARAHSAAQTPLSNADFRKVSLPAIVSAWAVRLKPACSCCLPLALGAQQHERARAQQRRNLRLG